MSVFKVFRPNEWQDFTQHDLFKGSADDLRDGFIHFSTEHNLAGTLAKYYQDKPRIIIALMESKNWGDELKWEISRGGGSFPHLYTSLKMKDVIQHWDMSKDDSSLWDLSNIEAAMDIRFAPPDV